MHAGPDSFPMHAAWGCSLVDPVRSSMRGGSPDQVDELEPAGDVGGVGVVVVGDQEPDRGRSTRPRRRGAGRKALRPSWRPRRSRPCRPGRASRCSGRSVVGDEPERVAVEGVLLVLGGGDDQEALPGGEVFHRGELASARPRACPASKAKRRVSGSSESAAGDAEMSAAKARTMSSGCRRPITSSRRALPSALRLLADRQALDLPLVRPPWRRRPSCSRAGPASGDAARRRPRRRRSPRVGPPSVPARA